MRAHGVTDYPDSGQVQATPGSDLDPDNPTYVAAKQACRSLQPASYLSPAQQAQAYADELKFAQCMRGHGITKWPDPQGVTSGNSVVNLSRSGIDFNSPQFQAANLACQHYLGPYGKE
jgi:hypothetical protein